MDMSLNRVCRYACTFLLAVLGPLLVHANELADRSAVREDVKTRFIQEDFAGIEKKHAELVKSRERFGSGTMKSDEVYAGLSELTQMPRALSWVLPTELPTPAARQEHEAKKEAFYIALNDKALKWRKQFPMSSLPAYLQSDVFIAHGFYHRGTQLARDTNEARMGKFVEYIAKAQAVLMTPGIERDAAWYCAVFRLAQFSGVDPKTLKSLVNEATDRFPNSYAIYFFASKPMIPKWGGSLEAFEWLANLAASKTRKTDGNALYARVYWNIAALGFDNIFADTHADWKKMRAGFEDMIKRYPSEWNLNHYARFACMAKDAPTFKKLFLRLGGQLNSLVWQQPEQLARCKRMANDG